MQGNSTLQVPTAQRFWQAVRCVHLSDCLQIWTLISGGWISESWFMSWCMDYQRCCTNCCGNIPSNCIREWLRTANRNATVACFNVLSRHLSTQSLIKCVESLSVCRRSLTGIRSLPEEILVVKRLSKGDFLYRTFGLGAGMYSCTRKRVEFSAGESPRELRSTKFLILNGQFDFTTRNL